MPNRDLLLNARRALLERRANGGWQGRLSSSALASATAVVALGLSRRAGIAGAECDTLVARGLDWLVTTRNADGGWGDTPDSASNVSTTALVWAALAHGRGIEAAARSAEVWIARHAGSTEPSAVAAVLADRYGRDRTFSVPILTTCAIAGRLGPDERAWALVPRLPFELAALPRGLFSWLRLPVVSYALPALITMGLARHRRGPRQPGLSAVADRVAPRALHVLEGLQPPGGGFLEAVPLTAFVTMSLIAAGEASHPVLPAAIEFLTRSAREDGSWPIDTNLATWVTTLAVNALSSGEDPRALGEDDRCQIRDWLLQQQWRVKHPYTGAAPGGWAWTDLSGGVPDADDTAGALIALAHLGRHDPDVRAAATHGVRWLLDLQNRDGGLPTFCRGWGALPFDRSGTDLTAHAIRAWASWLHAIDASDERRVRAAIGRAVSYLASAQRADGAFIPLWFGNQSEPREENPVYGTSRVISALSAAGGVTGPAGLRLRERAMRWLAAAQNQDGGWGGGPSVRSSIEETAIALTALAPAAAEAESRLRECLTRGFTWLTAATDCGRRFPSEPIGFYFARLWYAEALYPVIFTVAACEASAGISLER